MRSPPFTRRSASLASSVRAALPPSRWKQGKLHFALTSLTARPSGSAWVPAWWEASGVWEGLRLLLSIWLLFLRVVVDFLSQRPLLRLNRWEESVGVAC